MNPEKPGWSHSAHKLKRIRIHDKTDGCDWMKVTIERDSCVSCGQCWDTCPTFFEQNSDDSFSEIIEDFRSGGNIATGTPSADDEACVREAADLCPVTIIKIEE